ncbi:MAG: hypothetical protein MRY83_04600 [Flavobacteriales bacterium]|nr:hypothetical protein [Flavobacteriales bacterium]
MLGLYSLQEMASVFFQLLLEIQLKKKGIGSHLISFLKKNEEILNGWIVEDDMKYIKRNGEIYLSKIQFYKKLGFEIRYEDKWVTDRITTIKIKWKQLT